MEYMIKRTSGYDDETPPCKEAYRRAYARVDERTVDDPKKISVFKGRPERWYSEGKNHRVERGHIKRDFDDEAWFIEVKDLDALNALHKKYGDIIILDSWESPNIPAIEIYDDYRE